MEQVLKEIQNTNRLLVEISKQLNQNWKLLEELFLKKDEKNFEQQQKINNIKTMMAGVQGQLKLNPALKNNPQIMQIINAMTAFTE